MGGDIPPIWIEYNLYLLDVLIAFLDNHKQQDKPGARNVRRPLTSVVIAYALN
jgi:hypothetical protein